jgi:putative hemolysin
MRIWDIPPERLCGQHLLGEHRELHAIWTVITESRSGYSKHPETLRWVDSLAALYTRHEAEVTEMERRGYHHRSPLDIRLATGKKVQEKFVDTIDMQVENIHNKGCNCNI